MNNNNSNPLAQTSPQHLARLMRDIQIARQPKTFANPQADLLAELLAEDMLDRLIISDESLAELRSEFLPEADQDVREGLLAALLAEYDDEETEQGIAGKLSMRFVTDNDDKFLLYATAITTNN
jgi:hypothetical protein